MQEDLLELGHIPKLLAFPPVVKTSPQVIHAYTLYEMSRENGDTDEAFYIAHNTADTSPSQAAKIAGIDLFSLAIIARKKADPDDKYYKHEDIIDCLEDLEEQYLNDGYYHAAANARMDIALALWSYSKLFTNRETSEKYAGDAVQSHQKADELFNEAYTVTAITASDLTIVEKTAWLGRISMDQQSNATLAATSRL